MSARPTIPRLGRFLHHVHTAWKHRGTIQNWKPIALASLGLRRLNHGEIVHVASGLRFALGDASDAWAIVQMFGRNDYRVQKSEPWRSVVDIGANIGTFAVLAARAAPAAQIVCCEPSSDTCRLLRTNLALNGFADRVSVLECAVAGAEGSVVLSGPPQSSLRTTAAPPPSRYPSFRVPAVSLATVFGSHGIGRCDFLKIDCEGAEYEILRACDASVLDRVDRIALEFHEWGPGQDHRELVAILSSSGFTTDHAYDPWDPRTGLLFATRRPEVL